MHIAFRYKQLELARELTTRSFIVAMNIIGYVLGLVSTLMFWSRGRMVAIASGCFDEEMKRLFHPLRDPAIVYSTLIKPLLPILRRLGPNLRRS